MLESILHLTSECFFDFHHFTARPRKQRVNEKWIWRLFESAKRCFCVLLRFTGAEAFVKSRAVTHGHILTSQKNLLYLLETFCRKRGSEGELSFLLCELLTFCLGRLMKHYRESQMVTWCRTVFLSPQGSLSFYGSCKGGNVLFYFELFSRMQNIVFLCILLG